MKLLVQAIIIALLAACSSTATAEKTEFVDATVDLEFRHPFEPVSEAHNTQVLIDRFHKTVYTQEGYATGAQAMLDILDQDGFAVRYAETSLSTQLDGADILVIHGLPNLAIELANDTTFWKSPLADEEIESIVRWVSDGGGLFLTLSHFPNGSGALPLLEAFEVKFRDGYIYSKEYPSYTDPENGRCSHYFGLSERDSTLNTDHPMLVNGLKVEKVDFLCGAAIFRKPEDAVILFPPGSGNFDQKDILTDTSDLYAGMIGFQYGKGKVVVVGDQGMFRNFIFEFDNGEKVHVTITSPDNDNANLFINMMRWLSPGIGAPAVDMGAAPE